MSKLKNNKGITLMTLVITIIVLLIIVSITVNYGIDSINKAQIQNMQTNMLLIEAKAKKYVENANFQLGVKPDEATDEMKEKSSNELKGKKVTENDGIVSILTSIGISIEEIKNGNTYQVSNEDLAEMGIKGVVSNAEKGWYIIVYDVVNANAKIYNTNGIKTDDGEKYCLDDIRNIEI